MNLGDILDQKPDLLAGIIASAMDAIIAMDDSQRIVLFNAAAERVFACPANEAIGNSVERFIPQRFRAGHSTRVRRFDESGITNRTFQGLGTLWGLRGTGEEFPMEASISRVESAGKKFFTAVIRDVSERYQAEEALRESEKRFQLVADTAPVLMWMSGTDKLCNYFNKPWLDFTGRSIEEELGNGWAEGVHPEDLQRCLDTYTRSFDRRENFRMEYRLRRRDGAYRWVLDIGVPRFNEEGSFVGYIGVCVDVTERKCTEETLLRYAAIVESSNEAILGLDMNGTITDWNKGAERLFGYSATEAIGKNVLFLSPDDSRDDAIGVLKKVLQGEPVSHHETVRQRKDTTRVEISLTVSPIINTEGRIVGVSGIARDITERKRSEEIRSRHSAIVESSEDAIISTNWDGIIQSWNTAAQHTFGYTETEAIGQPITILIPTELWDEENTILKRLRVGECIKHYETVRVTKAGKQIDVSLSISPIKDSTGKVQGSSRISRDITEQKLAEETLRKSEERFRLAAQAGKMFSYEWDVATDLIVRSPEAAKILGIDEAAQTTGQQILAQVHADDREKLKAAVATLSPENPYLQISYRVVRPNGAVIWIERNSRAHFDQQGRMLRVVGMVSDITERKLAEERLRESEEQFRTLAESIPQLCWMARGDGYIFWYNQRWYKYTGTVPEQMEGWGWQSVHDRRTLPNVLLQWMTSISTGKPFDMVIPLKGADSVFRPFLTRVMPIRDADGRVARWFGTSTDVTELRDAQEALRTSEERLRLAQKVARIGSFEWNVQTGVNIWTPELEAMYGLSPGGFGGTESTFKKLIHPDDLPIVLHSVNEALKTGRPMQVEWRIIWPDGSVHWIAGRWQALLDESGQSSRMVGVNIDITERKKTEEALSAMTRKLIEGQEQERARIARELHDDITQRLAMLAIDIEQMKGLRAQMPSEIRDWTHELSKRAKEISADVQVLSHELHSSRLEYLGIVGGMKSWCNEFAEQQRMEIGFNPDVSSAVSPEISLCLFRVLQEALHNAAKHSGVKRVDVQLREESGEIQLIVSDLGKGFDVAAARQDRGLGITSMQERVRLVRGTILIDSEPRAGTTIRVRMPLSVERSFKKAAE